MRNRVDLTQDRDYWMALVNVALNLWVQYAMELVSVSHSLRWLLFMMASCLQSRHLKVCRKNCNLKIPSLVFTILQKMILKL